MIRLTRPATDTATRPCPSSCPAGLYLIKADTLHPWLLLVSLTFLTLGLLCPCPAYAQGGYPGGPK